MPRADTATRAKLTRTVQMRFEDQAYDNLRSASEHYGLSLGEVVRTLCDYAMTAERFEQAFEERQNRKIRDMALEQWLENGRRTEEDDRPL